MYEAIVCIVRVYTNNIMYWVWKWIASWFKKSATAQIAIDMRSIRQIHHSNLTFAVVKKELIIHYTLFQNLPVFRWCCYDYFKYCCGHFSCPFLAGVLCCGPTVLKFCSIFKPCMCKDTIFIHLYSNLVHYIYTVTWLESIYIALFL